MQLKRLYGVVAVLLTFAMLFTACTAPTAAPAAPAPAAGEAAATDAATTEATAEGAAEGAVAAAPAEIKIGLVTDVGRVNDRSFNQSSWDGVRQAAAALGLTENEDFKYIETQDSKEYADNIQQFVDAGYNVVVTVGFALGEATSKAAAENPDIYFIGVDQEQLPGGELPNVTGLVFPEDQSGFLAGALAAQLSQSGNIAAVLGTDLVPAVARFGIGYANGAKFINPDITVSTTYHPGEVSQAFVDPEWGAATARQAIDQGADVIFGAGGQTGNGALQETAAAVEAGGTYYCIGVDTDQWETLPAAHPCLVSSAVKDIVPSLSSLIADFAADGTMVEGNYFGMAGLAPFHDFEDKVPQEVKDKLAEISAGFADGSVTTGYQP